MGVYELSKKDRQSRMQSISQIVSHSIGSNQWKPLIALANDSDTYVRKAVYQNLAKNFQTGQNFSVIAELLVHNEPLVRQTATYALGEIGKNDARIVFPFLEKQMCDDNSRVRNAVIGALKRMGEKNPKPTLKFVVHGIELRGRTHPHEVLPLLWQVRDDPDRRVRKMVVHVLGQISYKKGCLEKVIGEIVKWENECLVSKALAEIIEVHSRNEKFSYYSMHQVIEYMKKEFCITQVNSADGC